MKLWLTRWWRYLTPWSMLSQDDIIKTPRWYRYYVLRRKRHVKCPSCGHRSGPAGEPQKMVWSSDPVRMGLQRQCGMCSAVWMEQSILDPAAWNKMAPVQADESQKQRRFADREPHIVKSEPEQPARKVS